MTTCEEMQAWLVTLAKSGIRRVWLDTETFETFWCWLFRYREISVDDLHGCIFIRGTLMVRPRCSK